MSEPFGDGCEWSGTPCWKRLEGLRRADDPYFEAYAANSIMLLDLFTFLETPHSELSPGQCALFVAVKFFEAGDDLADFVVKLGLDFGQKVLNGLINDIHLVPHIRN